MAVSNWLEIAKSLPCGTKIKVQCCGNSPSMLISHGSKGYSCHCFRCIDEDAHKFQPHGHRSLGEIQKHKAELQEHRGKPPYLPKDYIQDIPKEAAAWFLQYGIPYDVALSYGFGYSEFFHRIVIPVYTPTNWPDSAPKPLAAVHLRALSANDKPKYLNLGKPDPNAIFWGCNSWSSPYIIITEDILSAIKINLAGFNSCAINGSSCNETQALRIKNAGKKPVIWLDGDAAGIKGRKEVEKQLMLLGVHPQVIGTPQDPKTYSRTEIRDIIHRCST